MTACLRLGGDGRENPAPRDLRRTLMRRLLVPALIGMLFQIGEATAMADIQCEIRSRPGTMGLELTGVLWSDRELSGDYSFIVDSQGPGGVSKVAQRGHFTIEAGGSHILGTVTVNAATGGNLLARLTIRTDETSICTAEL